MTSTQLKMSRRWLAQQMALQIRVGGKIITPPSFSHMYEMKTSLQTKDNFVWSGWDIGSPVIISDANLYQAAKKFSKDIEENSVKITPPPSDIVNAEETKVVNEEAF
jgi:hypothetical protein